ncbi:MAG: PspA/IM30 family protein [Acidimicrobiaceae bacterium]|nr:PspA/IM30 family protein [Acidimicrobiaceae bacterium]
MIDLLRRRWKYLTAKSASRFEESADPKIQLEQAIAESQDQHRRLIEQAANVVANQKQTEMQLSRAMEELEKVNTSTRQALRMAQDASARGDDQKALEYNQTAEAFANRLIATENQVNDLKQMSLQTASAAQQARAAVQQNSTALQQKLAERQKLLSQLDQAKMQEQLNTAMSTLSQTVGQDVPTLDQVRSKIEARYARAIGSSELSGQTTESRMLEVQQAAIGIEAKSRLDAMRAEMGLPAGESSALGSGEPAPAAALGQGAENEGAPAAEDRKN